MGARHTHTHIHTDPNTHTQIHNIGLDPAWIGGPVPPLLSPCWLLAVISHSRLDTPSITEAKLPSSLWPITHNAPVNSDLRYCLTLRRVFDCEGKTLVPVEINRKVILFGKKKKSDQRLSSLCHGKRNTLPVLAERRQNPVFTPL